jgi:hypothetical protein
MSFLAKIMLSTKTAVGAFIRRVSSFLIAFLLCPVPHIDRWGLYPPAIFIVVCYAYWRLWAVYPGYCVAALGFAAVIIAVRADKFGLAESVIWVFIGAFLVFGEIRVLYTDRVRSDREQAEERKRSDDRFQNTVDGFTTVLASQKVMLNKVLQTNQLAEQSLSDITGGESYCYLVFSNESPDKRTILLMAVAKGQSPLRDVNARLVNQTELEEIKKSGAQMNAQTAATNISIGDMAAGSTGMALWEQLKAEDEFNFLVQFSALNGFWNERIKLRMVDGQWQQALKVSKWVVSRDGKKGHEQVLFEPKPDPKFPLVDGKVDWSN